MAIDPEIGDIYVADRCNQRIQVFTAERIYKATLGVVDEPGEDNQHFNYPWGVAVDGDGNIFVADTENQRVQKCRLSGSGYTCTTFAGETGVFGDDFGHFHPLSVTVDQQGRVYVADEWNNRVLVYNANGAYLTTIAGGWGTRSGELRGPSGVAVDADGNVYVTDRDNHRIQKFAPGYPGWTQVNINGFGGQVSTISALEGFKGSLYAGSWEGQLWRATDGVNWSQFTPPWVGDSAAILDAQEFNSYLYLVTGTSTGGEIWRTDGSTWEQVVSQGFGDAENYGISVLAVFKNKIYVATSNYTTGLEIWRSAGGDPGSWTQVNQDGFGAANTSQDVTMEVYFGHLYVGFGRVRNGVAELWRSENGTQWEAVFTDGLGANNTSVSAMAELNGKFYIGLRNTVDGGEMWRSTYGKDWTRVVQGGLGDPTNARPYGLVAYENDLYLMFSNWDTGAEVWRSADGIDWTRIAEGGWGDSNNFAASYYDKAGVVYNNRLYLGTYNWAYVAEIWRLNREHIYLPISQR